MSVRITPLIRTPFAVYPPFLWDTLSLNQLLVQASESGDPAPETANSIP